MASRFANWIGFNLNAKYYSGDIVHILPSLCDKSSRNSSDEYTKVHHQHQHHPSTEFFSCLIFCNSNYPPPPRGLIVSLQSSIQTGINVCSALLISQSVAANGEAATNPNFLAEVQWYFPSSRWSRIISWWWSVCSNNRLVVTGEGKRGMFTKLMSVRQP